MPNTETPQSQATQTLVIHCRAPNGYRRAGLVFKFGNNPLDANSVNATQLAQLKADPRLAVVEAKPTNKPSSATPHSAHATQADSDSLSSRAMDEKASQGDLTAPHQVANAKSAPKPKRGKATS